MLLRVLVALVSVVVLVFGGSCVANYWGRDFSSLPQDDQFVLDELDRYLAATKEHPVWEGYQLNDMTLAYAHAGLGAVYLINPVQTPSAIVAAPINMDTRSGVRVYRLAAVSADSWSMRIPGNRIPTAGESLPTIAGGETFWTQLSADSVGVERATGHAITFLTHEGFHQTVQREWPLGWGDRFDTDSLTDDQLEQVGVGFAALQRIREELDSGSPDEVAIRQGLHEYLAAFDAVESDNPDFVSAYRASETVEGTAQYVGYKSSELVGYDIGVMDFKNRADVPFTDIVPTIQSGELDSGYLSYGAVYESGTLLCEALDALHVEYQPQLNGINADTTITLSDVVRESV